MEKLLRQFTKNLKMIMFVSAIVMTEFFTLLVKIININSCVFLSRDID